MVFRNHDQNSDTWDFFSFLWGGTELCTKKIRRCMEIWLFFGLWIHFVGSFYSHSFGCCCSLCFSVSSFFRLDVALSHPWTQLVDFTRFKQTNKKITTATTTTIKNELNDKLHNIPCNYTLFIIRPILRERVSFFCACVPVWCDVECIAGKRSSDSIIMSCIGLHYSQFGLFSALTKKKQRRRRRLTAKSEDLRNHDNL